MKSPQKKKTKIRKLDMIWFKKLDMIWFFIWGNIINCLVTNRFLVHLFPWTYMKELFLPTWMKNIVVKSKINKRKGKAFTYEVINISILLQKFYARNLITHKPVYWGHLNHPQVKVHQPLPSMQSAPNIHPTCHFTCSLMARYTI